MPMEQREFFIDLQRFTVPRVHLGPHASVGHSVGGDPVIGALKFRYRSGADGLRARQEAWDLIRPVIEDQVTGLAHEGWELMVPLREDLLRETNGKNEGKFWLSIALAPFTVFLSLLWTAYLVWFAKGYWFSYVGIRLPMRRELGPGEAGVIADAVLPPTN